MKSQTLASSVLATLAYSSVFQYPLTEKELKTRLIGQTQITDQNLKQTLNKLQQLGQIATTRSYWFLKKDQDVVQTRQRRAHFSQLKNTELKTLITLLSNIPMIHSVYVTGSLAMQNVSSVSDDIDILIITKSGMMWFTRLIVVIWTTMLGKYRLHGSNGEWGWCFNLWLDQNHLEVPKQDRSVYTAYEVVQAKQVLGTQNELLGANRWVSEYINCPVSAEDEKDYKTRREAEGKFSNFQFSRFYRDRSIFKTVKNVGIILVCSLDFVCYVLQRAYMQPKRSREKVGLGFAFFHPRDTKNLVLGKWMEKLERLGMSREEVSACTDLFSNGGK